MFVSYIIEYFKTSKPAIRAKQIIPCRPSLFTGRVIDLVVSDQRRESSREREVIFVSIKKFPIHIWFDVEEMKSYIHLKDT